MVRWTRILFCIAVAIMAAAAADPLVEFGSNAGLFGPGNYTDHSNLDVVPAVLVALLFAALHLFLRIRGALMGPREASRLWLRQSSDALGSAMLLRLLPAAFAIQIVALYSMETAEQFVVAGHAFGGTIWLGGPTAASLTVHAAFCLIVTLTVGRTLRAFARTAVQIVRLIRELATLPAHCGRPLFLPLLRVRTLRLSSPIPSRIGERAPPVLVV